MPRTGPDCTPARGPGPAGGQPGGRECRTPDARGERGSLWPPEARGFMTARVSLPAHDSPPVGTPEEEDAHSPRRSALVASVAAALMSLPFVFYGLVTLETKARVEFKCEPNGPCVLTRASWLSQEEVGRFTLEEMRGAKVERNRKTGTSDVSIWRPVLVTTRGDFPLSYAWMREESKAQYPAGVVGRYLAKPYAGGVTLWHDDRAGAARMGALFLTVGGLLVALSVWQGLKARRLRLAEEAGASRPVA